MLWFCIKNRIKKIKYQEHSGLKKLGRDSTVKFSVVKKCSIKIVLKQSISFCKINRHFFRLDFCKKQSIKFCVKFGDKNLIIIKWYYFLEKKYSECPKHNSIFDCKLNSFFFEKIVGLQGNRCNLSYNSKKLCVKVIFSLYNIM